MDVACDVRRDNRRSDLPFSIRSCKRSRLCTLRFSGTNRFRVSRLRDASGFSSVVARASLGGVQAEPAYSASHSGRSIFLCLVRSACDSWSRTPARLHPPQNYLVDALRLRFFLGSSQHANVSVQVATDPKPVDLVVFGQPIGPVRPMSPTCQLRLIGPLRPYFRVWSIMTKGCLWTLR